VDWKDNAKAQLGRNAACIWLVGGVILFLIDGGVSHLYSPRAAAFLVLGMIAATIVIGGFSYFIINALATRFMARYPDLNSPEAQAAMRTWRNIPGVVNSALAILFLLWVYGIFFWY